MLWPKQAIRHRGMPKILVIGGTGFIGKNLCQHFIDKNFQVFSLSRRSPEILISGVHYFLADLSNTECLKSIFGENHDCSDLKFDFVVNCGGNVDHRLFNNGGINVIEDHFLSLLNLLNILDRSSIKRWVQFGSSDQYGSLTAPQAEIERERSFSPYSFAKTAADHFLQMLWRTEGFPVTSLRLFLAYGPGQNIQRFIPQVITACLANKKFPTSEGRQIRDFCYITDIINAVECCFYREQVNGEILNLGSGYPGHTIRDVIELIQSKVGMGQPEFGMVPYRKGENMNLVANIEKTKKVLDWHPVVKLDEGILNCIEYYTSLK